MSITGAWVRGYRKIRRVAACDLVLASKFRYLLDLEAGFFFPATLKGYREYRMQGDISVALRENSTDGKVFEEIFIEKTYAPHVQAIPRKAPVILIDLGANIGLSAIALARELQPVSIVAVEPDRGNFALLQENLRRAKLEERYAAVQAFAGVERGFAELVDSGNGAWGMRMGAAAKTGIPVLPIEHIISMAERMAGAARGPATVETSAGATASFTPLTPSITTVIKCDIEGAEAQLFRRLHQWEDRADYVILELHTEFLSVVDFHACLAGSRYHWRIDGAIPPGAVLAVVGLERLELKAAAQSRRAAGS
jgi:FkbM family methyltransferase